MTDTNTLASCPFCGGAARRSTGGTGGNAWFGAGCGADQSCPAHLRALVHRTQAEADATWNRRAPAPAASEAQPYAYEFSRDNGDGTYSAHIARGALREVAPGRWEYAGPPKGASTDQPIKALYESTQAQPVAAIAGMEPVAWTVAGDVTNWSRDFSKYKTQHYVRPVFTAAQVQAMLAAPSGPAREPLTEEQVSHIIELFSCGDGNGHDVHGIARAIEALAHGIHP